MSGQSNVLIVLGIGVGIYLLTKKKSVTVPSSNIIATAFPTPTIPAGTYNTVTVDITWTNTGEQSDSFIPKVNVGSIVIDLGEGTIILAPGEIHHSVKTLTGVTAGSQNICPVPS